MTPLYATPSDVLAYPKESTKTLVYPPALPPTMQAVDRLISVHWLCLICIINLLFSILIIYLDRLVIYSIASL